MCTENSCSPVPVRYFPAVYFEISDICNATCPWCERGSRTRKDRPFESNKSNRGKAFIPLSVFMDRILFLMKKKFIIPGCTIIHLYNWGEPFLHPYIYEIISFLKEAGLFCGLSTNGSIEIENKVPFDHVHHLYMSMPGLTQESYDRAHGFSAKKTLETIIKSVENAKKANINPESIYLYAHEYKQNKLEVKQIEKFARNLGVSFLTNRAFFNCFEYAEQYMQGNLPSKILEKAQEDLYLRSPENYIMPENPVNSSETCAQFLYLSLSHTGKLSVCCNASLEPDEYEILDFDSNPEITYSEIQAIRKNSRLCIKCRKLGLNRVLF